MTNGHITSNLFSFDAIISSFAIVMGLQRGQKQGQFFHLLKEHSSMNGKVIQYDSSDNISQNAY